MNAKLVGTALVVTSSVKREDIERLSVRCPDALNLYHGEEDKKELIFTVGLTDGDAEIQDFCIVFNSQTHDDAKRATATIMLRGDLGKDPKETIADLFGPALKNLAEWEAGIPAILQKVDADHAELVSMVQI